MKVVIPDISDSALLITGDYKVCNWTAATTGLACLTKHYFFDFKSQNTHIDEYLLCKYYSFNFILEKGNYQIGAIILDWDHINTAMDSIIITIPRVLVLEKYPY